MLTVRDVTRIAEEEEVEIISRNGLHPKNPRRCKGLHQPHPSGTYIYLYLKCIKGVGDLGKTIIHEFLHLRDYLIGTKGSERAVEREAEETYYNHPEVLEFILDLYELRDL